jgi:hypothetical protein
MRRQDMILVRDIFQLKFGKSREAIELWKEGIALMGKSGFKPDRFLTDLSGPYYTFVMEHVYDNLSHYENKSKETRNDEWRNWYHKFSELVESGRREIFNIVQISERTSMSSEKAYASTTTR